MAIILVPRKDFFVCGFPKGRHTHKSVFLVVGPLRFYPPYTNGLVVHANFFFLVL